MYSDFNCRDCQLWKTTGSHIVPEEPINKPVFVLVSQPIVDTVRKTNLKENSAWLMVSSWLSKADIDESEVYYSSLIRCYFDRTKNELSSLKECQGICFNKYVIKELEIVKPKVIIALGRDATEFLGGKEFLKSVGKPLQTLYGVVIPTYTPTYLDRQENKNLIGNVIAHLKSAKDLIKQTVIEYDYSYVDTWDKFCLLMDKLEEEPVWTFDIEGTSTDYQINEMIGIGFSWKRYQGCYLPLKQYFPIIGLQPYWKENQQSVIDALRYIFKNGSQKGAQNGKYDTKCMLKEYDIQVENFSIDSLLLASVISQGAESYSLDTRSNEYLDLKDYKKDMGDPNLIYRHPIAKVALYNNKDTDLTLRIIEDDLEKLNKNEKLANLFHTIMMPLNHTVTRMEFRGIKIDVDYAVQFHIEAYNELQALQLEVEKAVGIKFNIGSSKQLGEVLFDKLKLPILDKKWITDKGNRKTGKDVLEALFKKTDNAILKQIIRYNSLDATKSAFIDGFVPKYKRKDNKENDYLLDKNCYYHGNFKLTSATGRLRSGRDDEDTEGGNSLQLQNIPRDRKFRNLFLPDEGHLFVGVDRAQIELRILAHLTQDKGLLRACYEDYDLHSFVASMMLGLSYEDILKEKGGKYKWARDLAKNVGFGWVYGAAPGKFAYLFPGITQQEKLDAEVKARERYFERFNRILPWKKAIINEAKENGFVQSITGRLIYTPKINIDLTKIYNEEEKKRLRGVVMHAERQLVNAVIQGPASDITIKAGIDLDTWIIDNKKDARLLNFVHDAIYCSVNPNIVKEFTHEMDRLMCIQHFGITAKLKNDVKVWDKWEGKDLTKEYLK